VGGRIESEILTEVSGTVVVRASGFSIQPGERIDLEGTIEDSQPSIWMPPGAVSRELDTTYLVPILLEPAEELSRIGIDPDVSEPLVLTMAYSAGGWFIRWPGYLAVVVGLLFLLALVLQRARWGVFQPSLEGHLLSRSVLGSTEESAAIRLSGRSWEVTDEDGSLLFSLRAMKYRGKTRIAIDATGPEVVLEPRQASKDDLRPNDRLRLNDSSGAELEYRLLSSRRVKS
jgi:hypothetical protein